KMIGARTKPPVGRNSGLQARPRQAAIAYGEETMRTLRVTHAGAAAAVTLAAGVAAPAGAQAGAHSAGGSSDSIVTATKRAENVRNIPIPISAVTGEQLAKSNANSLSDYIARLPGVVFNDYQPGVSEVVIRGVAATTYHEQGQTTVGYYLNEFVL